MTKIKKSMIGALIIIALLLGGCVTNNTQDSSLKETTTLNQTAMENQTYNESESVREKANSVERIEVYHFHGTRQCYSCIKVGELAEKTLNTYFKDELESGKLVFGHINGELSENRELVKKYGVTSSSLWIGTYINGEFHKEQNTKVWYKIENEQDYLTYLKGILEKKLAGDLS